MHHGHVNLLRAAGLILIVPLLACDDTPLDLEHQLICTSALGCEADSTTLGPAGGTVSFRNGTIIVTVPEGALTEYLKFGTDSAPTWSADPLVNSGTPIDFRPHDVTFGQDITLTLQYDPTDRAEPVLEHELRLFRFLDGIWEEVPNSSIDTAANNITANLTSFSILHPRGVDAAAVIVTPADTSVVEGRTFQLEAVVLDGSNDTLRNRNVVWSSSNVSTASVDTDGRVYAFRPDTATITASVENASATSRVIVTDTQVDRVEVEPSSLTLSVGQTQQLSATAYDAQGFELNRSFTWYPQEGPIAQVSTSGVVRGMGPGTAVIFAITEGVPGPASVTVTTPQVRYVRVTPMDTATYVGGSVQMTATPLDGNRQPVPGRVVRWESKDSSVATVTGGGLVTGVGLGTVGIVATDTLSGVDSTATIEVGLETEPPTVPNSLVANAVLSSRIDLTWSPSTDNQGVVGYIVSRDGLTIDTTAGTSYSDNDGLSPATEYTYTVRAYDAAGNVSAPSASASATTQGVPDAEAPTVPTNVSAVAVSSSQINLTWNASTDNVGVLGYEISRDGVALDSTSETTYVDNGLSPSTLYSYRVSAYDLAGNGSGPSAIASATTDDAPAGGRYWHTTFDLDEQIQEACGGAEWSGDNLSLYGGWTADGECDQITSDANYSGGAGGRGFRHKIGDGTNNNGGGMALRFANIGDGEPLTEMWVRVYIRYESGFEWALKEGAYDYGDGPAPHYQKLFYIRGYIAGYPDLPEIIPEFADGRLTLARQDPSGIPFAGSTKKWYDMYPTGASDGSWFCLEWHIKLDTDQTDGVAELWLDGELIGQNTSYDWSAGRSTPGWHHIAWGSNQEYIDNDGAVTYMDYDDIVIYTTTPPNVDAAGNPMIGPIGW